MSAPSPSPRPRDCWSHRYGFLIPIALVVLAGLSLLARADPDACVPMDPVHVAVGDAVYEIPAALLPYLYSDRGLVPHEHQYISADKRPRGRSGVPLRRWYCAPPDGAPIPVKKFSIHDDEIAEAIERGDFDYRQLPRAGILSVRSGTFHEWAESEDVAPEVLPGVFRIHCSVPVVWNLPRQEPVTATLCSAYAADSPDRVLHLKFYMREYESRPPVNGRGDWPEIAREAMHLIRSLQVTPQ